MKFEQALSGTRWEIISTLSKGDAAISEIAKATKTSIPNISQQAKLLEAYGLIKVRGEKRGGPGKPKLFYALAKKYAFIAVARPGFAAKRSFVLDGASLIMLNTLFWEHKEDHYYLQKFYWQQEEFVEKCKAIAIIDSIDQEIHLLVVAEEKDLEKLRKEFSKVVITDPDGKKKSIISWTHSMEEIDEGLKKKEEYYQKLVKQFHVLMDYEGVLEHLR